MLTGPYISGLGNIGSDNVLDRSELDQAHQLLAVSFAYQGPIATGDILRILVDGVPVPFTVTVSGVDFESVEYKLPFDALQTVMVKLKPEVWGADGERVVTATVTRENGSFMQSDQKRVMVSGDSNHWSAAPSNGDSIWFNPSTYFEGYSGPLLSAVGGVYATPVTEGQSPVVVPRSDGANYLSFGYANPVAKTGDQRMAVDLLDSNFDMSGKTSFSIFNVQHKQSSSTSQLFSLGTSDRSTGYISGYSAVFNWSAGASRAYAAGSEVINAPALVGLVTSVSSVNSVTTATDTAYLNGQKSAVASNNIAGYSYSDDLVFGGNLADVFETTDGSMMGDFILFNKSITHLAARQEIDSYLAAKYKVMGHEVVASTRGVYDLTVSRATSCLIDNLLDRRSAGQVEDVVSTAGSDWVCTGAGDDRIVISDLQFRQIDGGKGIDALVIGGQYTGDNDIVLADHVSNSRGDSGTDLAANSRLALSGYHKLQGIERIDLRLNAGAQRLTVQRADADQLSETNSLGVLLGDNDAIEVIGMTSNAAQWGYFEVDGAVYDQRWSDALGQVWVYARGGGLPSDLLRVVGSRSGDVLVGSSAGDFLQGLQGNDTLTGRAGADLFSFSAEEIGLDRITDFNKAEGDKLDLRGLLAGRGWMAH